MEAAINRLKQKINKLEEKITFLNETEVATHDALTRYRERDLGILAVVTASDLSMNKIAKSDRILGICEKCKKIQEDHDNWLRLEEYLSRRFHLLVNHGICPECENIIKTHQAHTEASVTENYQLSILNSEFEYRKPKQIRSKKSNVQNEKRQT
jgi:hypothetical protein